MICVDVIQHINTCYIVYTVFLYIRDEITNVRVLVIFTSSNKKKKNVTRYLKNRGIIINHRL